MGTRPGGGVRVDRENHEHEGGAIYYPPGPNYVDDRAAAEAREEEERRREKEARDKALGTHSDPSGGFFTKDQDPKTMFKE